MAVATAMNGMNQDYIQNVYSFFVNVNYCVDMNDTSADLIVCAENEKESFVHGSVQIKCKCL